MNKDIITIIKSEYKTISLYDIKIKKVVSNSINLCVFLDITYNRLIRKRVTSHGYSKRFFYDYLSEQHIKDELFDYYYYTKKESIDKKDLMSEKGIIVVGNIELRRIKKDGHLTKDCPSFLTSKSKFSKMFKKYITESVKEKGVGKTLKEFSSIEGLKLSRASIYNLIK